MGIDGYRYPGVSRSGIPQHLQVKPHEGFTPEAILPHRGDARWTQLGAEDAPEPFTATPPDWTEQGLCHGRWELFDDPDYDTFTKVVKPICASCPVRDVCLSEALEQEGSTALRCRIGVRGGLRPLDRVRLTAPEPPAECVNGHTMGDEGSYFVSNERKWRCRQCERDQRAARRERDRAA